MTNMSEDKPTITGRFKDVEQTPFSRNLTAMESQQMDMLIAPNESASDLLPDRARVVIRALDNLDIEDNFEKSMARQGAYQELSDAKAYSVREALAGVEHLEIDLQEKLADDDHFKVRIAVAENTNFDAEIRASLSEDPVEAVRNAAPSVASSSYIEIDMDEDAPEPHDQDGDQPDGITMH